MFAVAFSSLFLFCSCIHNSIIICSLLTLSLVIQALGGGTGRVPNSKGKGHINFRDSKLTRVLQPSLSGNARLAFICCATASGLFLEETKSTFLFASRIKHIKTQSKINVMDDASTLNKVHEELNETKRALRSTEQSMQALEVEHRELRVLLNIMTEQRDRAMARVVLLEKEKTDAENAAVLAEEKKKVTAAAVASSKATDVDKATGGMMAVTAANEGMAGQVGFLSNVVDKLRAVNQLKVVDKTRVKKDVYESRQELPETFFLGPTLRNKGMSKQVVPETYFLGPTLLNNGMPATIRTSSSSNISEVTSPTRYGSHRSVIEEPIDELVEEPAEKLFDPSPPSSGEASEWVPSDPEPVQLVESLQVEYSA